MPDAAWKRYERRLAMDWGAEARTPLSGEHSRHTSADTLHETVYIEAKLMADAPLWEDFRDLRQRADRYDKLPAILLEKAESPFRGICVLTPEDGRSVVDEVFPGAMGDAYVWGSSPVEWIGPYLLDHRVKKTQPYWSLMVDTVQGAREEGKVPVVCVSQKRCPGYLVLLPVGDWGTEGSS